MIAFILCFLTSFDKYFENKNIVKMIFIIDK